MANTREKVRFVYQKELQTSYQTDVWEILCASDKWITGSNYIIDGGRSVNI